MAPSRRQPPSAAASADRGRLRALAALLLAPLSAPAWLLPAGPARRAEAPCAYPAARLGAAGMAGSRRPRHRVLTAFQAAEVELPLEELVEREGEYTADLPPERLQALQRVFPTLDVASPGLRLLHTDPPIFVMEGLLEEEECTAFVEAMRERDGSFPERLGQSDLPAIPSWLNPLKKAVKGMPVLDWLGNPTVRWTYKSRNLLFDLRQKVRGSWGLDLEQGAANIKHYRADQWLPTHIDYNHATMMTYLNEVEEGGHTLFPTLGFKVRPKKGSALVWPNQPPLKHAGDRVVQGEKWILFYNWPAEQNWEYQDNFDFNE